MWRCKILQLAIMNKIYDFWIFTFGMFNFEWFYQTKEFLKVCTVLQDQGLYLEFYIEDLLLCLFYCFIHVYPKATWDVEGIKDLKDVLRTYAVIYPKRRQFCCILPNLLPSSFATYSRPTIDYVNPWTGHTSRTPLGLVLHFLPQ